MRYQILPSPFFTFLAPEEWANVRAFPPDRTGNGPAQANPDPVLAKEPKRAVFWPAEASGIRCGNFGWQPLRKKNTNLREISITSSNSSPRGNIFLKVHEAFQLKYFKSSSAAKPRRHVKPQNI